jgi:hypothetical protein
VIVAASDNGVLILGFCDDDIAEWKQQKTVNFERMPQYLTRDVVTFYEPTRAALLERFKEIGSTAPAAVEQAIKDGQRTDNPRKVS